MLEVNYMGISKGNIRTLITIPRDLKEKLEKIGEDQNRTLGNLIVTVLKEYAEK